MTHPRFLVALTPQGTVRMRDGLALIGTDKAQLRALAEGCDSIESARLVLPMAKGGKGRGLRTTVDRAWIKVRRIALDRDGNQCVRCRSTAFLEVHHVEKRAHAPAKKYELSNLATLCRTCHQRTDWPFEKGKLVIVPMGGGTFLFELVTKFDKWAPDPVAL